MAQTLVVALLLVIQTAFTLAEKPLVVCNFGGHDTEDWPGIDNITINDFPISECTHIIYANVGMSRKELSLLHPMCENQDAYQDFTALASQNPDVKALVGLGGRKTNKWLSKILRKSSKRETFTRNIVEYLNENNFDGLVIDWEYPEAEDRNNLVTFIDELRSAFSNEQRELEIVTSLPVRNSQLEGFDVAQLCSKSHFIVAKALDLHTASDGFADVPTPLVARPFDNPPYDQLNINDRLSRLESLGCPKNRMVLAIGFYGRTSELRVAATTAVIGPEAEVVGPGKAGVATKEPGFLAYFEICTKLRDEQTYIEATDEIGQAAYAIKGTEFIGYDNPHTVQSKIDFIRAEGLLGAMIKDIDLDDYLCLCQTESYPLTKIVQSGLRDYEVPRMINRYNRLKNIPSAGGLVAAHV